MNSRKVYDNPWIRIDEDQVINPSGKQGIYGRVQMKNLAVGIIPIDSEGNTWLVGQYRYMLNAYSWEIPMGGCPEGESTMDAAKRELREETGLIAGKLREIQTIHTSNSVTNEKGIVFIAQDLTQGDHEHEETEDITVVKLSLSDAISMALNNQITDSISVAGLLKIAHSQDINFLNAKPIDRNKR